MFPKICKTMYYSELYSASLIRDRSTAMIIMIKFCHHNYISLLRDVFTSTNVIYINTLNKNTATIHATHFS